MNPMKAAAWNFWYTLSSPETTTVYQLTIAKTWQLLKQVVQLVVLLALFLAMVAVWLWAVSFQSGRSFRVWLETEQPTIPELLSKGQQLIWGVFKPTLNWMQTQLKTQYGLEIKLPPMPEFKQLEATSTVDSSPTTSKTQSSGKS
ncbi:hypothetical protein H6F76_03440 [Leptolyngbya sp. FACHB-321]|uniref:hypothetical protein n=1 Tax=Leptolyngbya sp. FACHB-321 TaxID=2692807 RepID=UPI0016877548|nr:hypothetical protein [Leptolyngbya sp. FACHB-321]MBD2034102.1 hypothetical protein [Leptolyngbya sp. FACHB-321]